MGNPGKPGYRPTPQNRALALKARFLRFLVQEETMIFWHHTKTSPHKIEPWRSRLDFLDFKVLQEAMIFWHHTKTSKIEESVKPGRPLIAILELKT